ncbi:2-keto-4-pentenoate hydratase/2-oxohepta-3-ene-1,7-dioic acid hydratase in catechol pathway [Parvibaculum indicum]|uniref:fumarylacetoacetate hydrolase family protein n=1 Tax=Parvibaculum indicum TaxID=562969 RepID=UPI00141E6DCC|nr:fumarylacetoacetate hydrolase family protein [Parvibaculum indicum]NIJ41069.1 2-keto-4-pentenoate hydratase/2-oxohepta-3-ene-1,7-dioic acid hydratase in catechol pathway [Parvibaculum indicum]
MRLVRFGGAGAESPGLLDDEGRVRDLSGHVGELAGETLSPESLERLRGLDRSSLPLVPDGVRLGVCVAGTGKILCIGKNYADHAAEMKSDLPPEPLLFMKATSALAGPFDEVCAPRRTAKLDYEGELALVIGRATKYVSEADALAHVAGYTIMNDVSERAFQNERGGQFTKGKSSDGFAPLGPWLVTTDEIADPQALRVRTWVDDELRQDGNTSNMIFSAAFIVSYLSEFMTLYPGDVISTGTPHGVAAGMTPPGWVRDGQTVRVAIDGLGEIANRFTVDK